MLSNSAAHVSGIIMSLVTNLLRRLMCVGHAISGDHHIIKCIICSWQPCTQYIVQCCRQTGT